MGLLLISGYFPLSWRTECHYFLWWEADVYPLHWAAPEALRYCYDRAALLRVQFIEVGEVGLALSELAGKESIADGKFNKTQVGFLGYPGTGTLHHGALR